MQLPIVKLPLHLISNRAEIKIEPVVIIKIDKASIKKNPKAGNTVLNVAGPVITRFELICSQSELKALRKTEGIKVTTWALARNETDVTGIIIDPNFDYKSLPGKWIINSDNNIETLYHLPEPSYLFKFERTKIKCSNCKRMILHSEIKEGYQDDCFYDICPECEATDTFEYKYQSISECV